MAMSECERDVLELHYREKVREVQRSVWESFQLGVNLSMVVRDINDRLLNHDH